MPSPSTPCPLCGNKHKLTKAIPLCPPCTVKVSLADGWDERRKVQRERRVANSKRSKEWQAAELMGHVVDRRRKEFRPPRRDSVGTSLSSSN